MGQSEEESPDGTDDDETGFRLIGRPVHHSEGELRARIPLEVLATQFVEELRTGLKPSVENYARRYPPHAEQIRESFPVLAMLENARIQNEAASFRRNMPEKFPFDRLGRCRLLCELGRGGMGVVFQAREEETMRLVAVKVLPWRTSIVPEWQKRFEQEARIAARMQHRNIVPVYRFGQEHGYCYYIMQFVDGIGLDLVIRALRDSESIDVGEIIREREAARPAGYVSGSEFPTVNQNSFRAAPDSSSSGSKIISRSSWTAFAQIGIQAAQALHYAHGKGIQHNDIKPGNLLLDAEGRIWVTDFGLSQPALPSGSSTGPSTRKNPALHYGFSVTRQGLRRNADDSDNAKLMGTLRYMAPERLVGTTDVRSDIYSLGLTLYELLTRRTVFQASSEAELKRQILETTPPSPRSINSQVPAGLDTIVRNCISRHPTERYSTAAELLGDLLRFTRSEKIALRSRSSFSGIFRAIRRGRE